MNRCYDWNSKHFRWGTTWTKVLWWKLMGSWDWDALMWIELKKQEERRYRRRKVTRDQSQYKRKSMNSRPAISVPALGRLEVQNLKFLFILTESAFLKDYQTCSYAHQSLKSTTIVHNKDFVWEIDIFIIYDW